MRRFLFRGRAGLILGCAWAVQASLPVAAAEMIEEVVVTARLRPESQQSIAASTSVLPSALIRERAAHHFEELLNAAPNVNYSGGASRGRFVQIRGIGEREQFVDPVDPSVGLYVDGIDFSGLGNAGTLFDVEQVEVLRGPQGIAFGASALAGLVNIRSAAPTREPLLRFEGGVSQYGGRTYGLVASGGMTGDLRGRIALARNRSDGYMRNDFLRRDDTNGIDESTMRARIAWQANEALDVDVIGLHVDVDNGYDAWSLDNDRHTLSDHPGRDSQRSDALALDMLWRGIRAFDVRALATWMRSDTEYGYDEDWSNPLICAGRDCEGWEYASSDRYLRDAVARSIDLRLIGRPGRVRWVTGAYAVRRVTDLERQFHDWDIDAPGKFGSRYRSGHVAIYGDVEWSLHERLTLDAGVRLERFRARYDDSLGLREQPAQWLRGGQITLRYEPVSGSMFYVLASRGYKAGGVNGDAIGKARKAQLDPVILDFLAARSKYAAELLDNYEAGWKYLRADGSLQVALAMFHMDRRNVQLMAWSVEGQQFVGYIDNAASGTNRGAEGSVVWQVSPRVRADASLGLLATRIEGFVANDPEHGFVDRSGHAQAQAPRWQFHAGAELSVWRGGYLRMEVEGKDGYYVSDSNEQKTHSFRLVHLGAGWRGERVELGAWVRNVFDERYAVQGFSFGNDPRKFYVTERYWQLGPPRVAGVTATYRFE